MSVLDLARPELVALRPYSSARMEASGGTVFLDANESPWPACADAVACNRYPEPQPAALLERLAELYALAPAQVLVGRGSDEGIDLLVRAFCRAGRDAIVISPPTFGMYAMCARVQDAEVIEAPLRADFSLDVDAVLATCSAAVKLVFVCAPNNPSGQGVQRGEILRLVAQLEDRALVVVDEAYIEFSEQPSLADCIGQFRNLVVLRTLSKAWALAGARLGVLLADADVVALLRKIMPPYPLSAPSVEIALQVLAATRRDGAHARIAEVLRERERMRMSLARLACVREVLPSAANFLSVRFTDAGAAFVALRVAGVVVRDVRRYRGLDDALRISMGTPAENDRVLGVLSEWVAREGLPA